LQGTATRPQFLMTTTLSRGGETNRSSKRKRERGREQELLASVSGVFVGCSWCVSGVSLVCKCVGVDAHVQAAREYVALIHYMLDLPLTDSIMDTTQ